MGVLEKPVDPKAGKPEVVRSQGRVKREPIRLPPTTLHRNTSFSDRPITPQSHHAPEQSYQTMLALSQIEEPHAENGCQMICWLVTNRHQALVQAGGRDSSTSASSNLIEPFTVGCSC
jgi:hypothetical protein